MSVKSATRFANDKASLVRYAAYLAYAVARLWRMRHDAAFPIYDGWTYYAKAIYLADIPRERLFTSEAFSFFAGRPPAPMWLTAPFMWVAPVFAVFAAALMLWTLVGIEWGVRCGIPRRHPWARVWAGVLILAGVGPFYHGFEVFYVDALLTGMTVAALGCAIGWLRRARLSLAVVGGVWLFLAILTKPAGLAVAASVGGVLAVGWVLKAWRKGRGPWSLGAPRRFWVSAMAWSAPVAAATAALWFTPYRTILVDAHKVFSGATLSRHYLVNPWSAEGLRDFWRMAAGGAGGPVLAACGVAVAFGLFRLWWRGGRLRGPATAVVLGALAMGLFAYLVPSRQARFFAPVAAMGLLATALVVSSARGRRGAVVLAALALGTCAFRVAMIRDMLPYSPLIGNADHFSYPMTELRDDLARVDESLRAHATSAAPIVLATDVGTLVESLKLVAWLHGRAPQPAACQLPPYCMFRPAFPPWPDFGTQNLILLPQARVLIARCPTGEPQPPGSGSRDWQIVNTALWNAEAAARLGWVEIVRRKMYAIYVDTTSESEEVAIRDRRLAFLKSLDLGSPSSREALGFLGRAIVPLGFRPPGRATQAPSMETHAPQYPLHAEYPGNPLPCSMRLPFAPDATLHLEMPRRDVEGDGVLVILSAKSNGTWREVRRMPLGLGGKQTVAMRDLSGGETTPTELQIHIDAGPQHNTTNDMVTVQVVRGE